MANELSVHHSGQDYPLQTMWKSSLFVLVPVAPQIDAQKKVRVQHRVWGMVMSMHGKQYLA